MVSAVEKPLGPGGQRAGETPALLVGNTWANPEARGAIHQHMGSGDRMRGVVDLHPLLAEQPQIYPPSAYFLLGTIYSEVCHEDEIE